MNEDKDQALEKLFQEYESVFKSFDDLSLARWLAQSAGHLAGGCWRISHPFIVTYKLAAVVAYDRQIWHKRLVNLPIGFTESPCCSAPFMPVLTRDVIECGLLCHHCLETIVPFGEIPENVRHLLTDWQKEYSQVHNVAHCDEDLRSLNSNYNKTLSESREKALKLLYSLGREIAPKFLDYYPIIIWEDQDECLGITPECLVK
ncbi:MAG: hypothetical protein ACP5MG_02165 [Verrucomicrobiia bacterium]